MAAVPAGVAVDRRTAPATDGSDIDLVVFRPEELLGQTLSCIVCFYGGRFVFGDATTDVRAPSALAADLGTVMVSVNYRLAPKHPFPTPFDDAFDALMWIADDNDLGIDPTRIVRAGISAGRRTHCSGRARGPRRRRSRGGLPGAGPHPRRPPAHDICDRVHRFPVAEPAERNRQLAPLSGSRRRPERDIGIRRPRPIGRQRVAPRPTSRSLPSIRSVTRESTTHSG